MGCRFSKILLVIAVILSGIFLIYSLGSLNTRAVEVGGEGLRIRANPETLRVNEVVNFTLDHHLGGSSWDFGAFEYGYIVLTKDGIEVTRINFQTGQRPPAIYVSYTPRSAGSWTAQAFMCGPPEGMPCQPPESPINITEDSDTVSFTVNPAVSGPPSITISVDPATVFTDSEINIFSTENNLTPFSPLIIVWKMGTRLFGSRAIADGYGNIGGQFPTPGIVGNWQAWIEYKSNGNRISNVVNVAVKQAASLPSAPTVNFTADPVVIMAGESSTLFWSSADATDCDATTDNWKTDEATGGSNVVSPAITTTYSLVCNGPGGSVNKSATVTVESDGAVDTGEGEGSGEGGENNSAGGTGSEEVGGGNGGIVGGLVPCGRKGQPSCTTCDIFVLASNVINFVLFTVTPAIAVLLFLIAGFMILLGGANPGLINTGKNIFRTTVYGLLLVFGAWMITNTILKSIAGDSDISDNWYKIECAVSETGAVIPPPPPPPVTCDGQQLAQQYDEPFPRANNPELQSLMACIRSEMGTANLGEISTYDKTYELCNYTRGNRIAGCTSSCSHAVNSCHYGGATGSGALAVDYGNEDMGGQIIAAAIRCGARNGRCETSSGQTIACGNSSATHVHINSASCDRN